MPEAPDPHSPTIIPVPASPELTLIPVTAEFRDQGIRHDERSDGAPVLSIGRYRIERQLGEGGFGVVYLGRDTELGRGVAIKLPHLHCIQDDLDRMMYLQEARTLAQLDHPAIVPVYDFGVIPDGRCFVVSKFIDGKDLGQLIAQEPLELMRAVEILITVGEALHHVHTAKLVHRDIKPGNLLLGSDGRVYVADFGLAMRESSVDTRFIVAGTPNYMSPEQARGEGHRMDGRSDQFSLGCVMYEFLTGTRPFATGSTMETLEKLRTQDPVPPREINPRIPRELNRICLKLLSKRPTHRYPQTMELVSDLRHWVRFKAEISFDVLNHVASGEDETAPASQSRTLKGVTIVPRGLRAFAREDAYFFLSLLPGTRDREGLPYALSHWKHWAASRDEDTELRHVGVISGPTGCGKSSLVRAGILPILDVQVVSVIVEATPDLTEQKLIDAIHRRCGEPLANTLPEALAAIRLGKGLTADQSVLIVIDQFEQWLHANPNPGNTELVRAIRQCDGIRVRCLIVVRDDFWLDLNRFMEAVEAPLMLGRNLMMVDLFELPHARNVLIELGRGYGRLPADPTPPSNEQLRFIDQVLSTLSVDGKMIPIRLTLFAEMVKNRDWHTATLRQLGGAVGIGEQYLTESFSVGSAPVNQRAHEMGARKVLQALLPAPGTEIKASRRPRTDLFAASGYEDDRLRFNALMSILESDLKLISATESMERSCADPGIHAVEQTSYQLSHDFFVPSIREWLSSRQRETYRGRLQNRLTEQAALWIRQREARFLPNFVEWLAVRWLIRPRSMAAGERRMMAAKDRHALTRMAGVLLVAVVLICGFFEYRDRARSRSLVDQLQVSSLTTAGQVAEQLIQYQARAQPLLQEAIDSAAPGSQSWFVMHVALVRLKPSEADTVFRRYLQAPIEYAPLVVESLAPFAGRLTPKCWEILEEPGSEITNAMRLRAGLLLAKCDPPISAAGTTRWQTNAAFVADQAIRTCTEHPDQYSTIAGSLTPISRVLIPELSRCVGAPETIETRFSLSLLLTFIANDSRLRTRLCVDAADWQRKALTPPRDRIDTALLREICRTPISDDAAGAELTVVSRRISTAAALLLGFPDQADSDELWALLKRSAIPDLRTHLIHALQPMNVPLGGLVSRLPLESDPGIFSALLMAIGEYPADDPLLNNTVKELVRDRYLNDPDAGVHSAAEWLLRRWRDEAALASLRMTPVADLQSEPSSPRQWLYAPQEHTFVLVKGMERPEIRRDFLISTKEITVAQYMRYDPQKYFGPRHSPTPDCPTNCVTWVEALRYCNWLSEQHGLPEAEWCYPRDPIQLESWRSDEASRNRLGYRMPTFDEWNFACRAETRRHPYVGDDRELVTKYEWCRENADTYQDERGDTRERTSAVGLLKPNDRGLFDMLGNVAEWSDEHSEASPNERVFCGFSVSQTNSKLLISDTNRPSFHPNVIYNSMGFRIVRTVNRE